MIIKSALIWRNNCLLWEIYGISNICTKLHKIMLKFHTWSEVWEVSEVQCGIVTLQAFLEHLPSCGEISTLYLCLQDSTGKFPFHKVCSVCHLTQNYGNVIYFFTASRTKKRAALVAQQLDSLLILQWCLSSNSETIIKVWHLWENLGRALLPVENMLSIFFWLYKAQMALNSPASPYSPATPTWHSRGARSPSPQSTCRQLPPQWRLWTLAIQFQFFHTPQEWKKNPSGNERLGRPEQGLQPHIPSFTLSHYTFGFSSSVYRTRSNSLPDGDLSAALSKTYGCRSDSMISSVRNLLEHQWRLEQAGCSRQKPARSRVAPSLSPSATDFLEGFNGRGHIVATLSLFK